MAHKLREEWLTAFVDEMRPVFKSQGKPLPSFIRVAIGFTSKGAKGRRVGECWDAAASGDRTVEIFVRPDEHKEIEVAGIVAHELCHAALTSKAKHGPLFKQLATAIGLEGKMTATTVGPRFVELAAPILKKLGAFPHARLDVGRGRSDAPPTQSTRLLKAVCADDGYTVRVTKKWVDVGMPTCPCGQEMTLA